MTTSFSTGGNIPTWELQDRIMRARRHAGLEQSELAELAGLSRKSISRYETGLSTPRRPALIAIALATGVDLTWLETGKAPAGDNPGGGGSVGHQGLEPRTRWFGTKPLLTA